MRPSARSLFNAVTKEAWAIAALLALIGLQYHALPSGYWRADDPAILLHAINSKGLSAFFDPLVWHKLSTSNLTPWLTLSFKVDLWLAGLSPQFFYFHSLCSLGLVAVAAYTLNRLWVAPVWAFLSVTLFLAGAPTASVTELLMTRHYLEGLLFALLSVIAFVHAMRQQSLGWAAIGALAYALAATAKEIYVPLVLVIPFIPPLGHLPTRLKLTAPYVAVAALYVVWRHYMLGAMVGGYADTQSIFSVQSVSGMFNALCHFPQYVFGAYWLLPTLVVSCALALYAHAKPGAIPVCVALALGVVVPLVPLIAFPGISGPDRYLFLFWFVASFACVMAIRNAVELRSGAGVATMAAGVCLCLLITGIGILQSAAVRNSHEAQLREFDVQGRFYFEAGQHDGFIPTTTLLNGYWYVTNLCDIKKHLDMECPVGLITGVPPDRPIDHLFAYEGAHASMAAVPGTVSDAVARVVSIDKSRPLSANVSVANGWARWRLGPYQGGQYYFAAPSIGRYPVPMDGFLRTPLTQLAFYVQYESPQGWATSSPLLSAGADQAVNWER